MESLYRNTTECRDPVEGNVQGTIPSWLSGNLYRNGPGTFSIGDSEYKHWFDGLALLHHFKIRSGKVTYQSRYVRSETYQKNMEANRIVMSEFGTTAYPDPCKNIFQRFLTWFSSENLTDNTMVTVTPQSDYIYTATETSTVHKLDPVTLETLDQVDLEKIMPINMATAHFHLDEGGTLHNVGVRLKGRPMTTIFRVPPPSEGKAPFQEAEVVGSFPCRWPFHLSYTHSFGMSENYYVHVEQPLCLNVKSMMLSKFTDKTFCECLEWYGNYKSVFHIMDRKTGELVNKKIPYVAKAFFTFHHINTYEDSGFLVIDLSGYDDAQIVDDHYLKNLKSETRDKVIPGVARRYVLPLNPEAKDPVDTSYITLPNCSATAVKQQDGSILCQYEKLADEGIELPQIHYGQYNGQKYRYIYGTGGDYLNKLVKIDTEEKSYKVWAEGELYTSEAVFVPTPGAVNEDDGVLLAVLYEVAQPNNLTYLLVLDAATMGELGRVRFDVHLPRDIHGVFLRDTPADQRPDNKL